MNVTSKNIVHLILLMIFSFELNDNPLPLPSWQQTNGPEGGTAYSFAFTSDGSVFAAANHGGLYKSTNKGADWRALNFPEDRVYCLLSTPAGTIFAAGGKTKFSILPSEQSLYRSDDNGSTWTKIVNTEGREITCLKTASNGYLFAGVKTNPFGLLQGGVYRSSDGGATWVFLRLNTEYALFDGIASLDMDNNDVIYAAGENAFGLYRSTDLGNNWVYYNTFAPNALVINKNNNHIFAVKTSSGVHRSTDGGVTWILVSSGYFTGAYNIEINPVGRLWAITESGIFSSVNDGDTWIAAAPIVPGHKINTVTSGPEGSLYAGLNNTFACKSTDNGNSWIPLKKGVIKSAVTETAFDSDNNIYAIGSGIGLNISSDYGDSWQLNTSLEFSSSKLLVNINDHVFTVNENKIYRSTNRGESWSSTELVASSKIAHCFEHDFSGSLYICYENSGIYKSADDGKNFLSAGFSGQTVNSMCFNQHGDIFLTVEGPSGGAYKSTNNGIIWTEIPSGNVDPLFIKINSLDHIFVNDRARGLMRSTNNGSSWANIQGVIPGSAVSMVINKQNIIYVSSYTDEIEIEIYMSSTNGDSWVKTGGNFKKNMLISPLIENADGYIFFSLLDPFSGGETGEGIWRTSFTTLTSSVSGHVRYADNSLPVNTGYVKALIYNKSSNEIMTADSSLIQQGGFYTLPHCPAESTFIMVYQDDEELDNFVPTHYPSTIDWKQAIQVYPFQDLYNIDVDVFRINSTLQNQYSVSGNIYGSHLLNLAGLKDAVVYVKAGNDFKSFGVSGIGGLYSASNLSPGSYTLTANRIGFDGSEQNIVINNSSLNNINFYLNNSLIGIQNITGKIPSSYMLYQNYPNPFNPATRIKFDIPVNSTVKLAVYDMLGREIEVLINGLLKAGSYEVNWDAGFLSSGIYFCKIETDTYARSLKMVLLK